MSGINIIRRWVIGELTKKADDGIMITLPNMQKVELNTNITAERLMRNGFDPNAFINTNQVENAINQINKRSVISQDDPRFRGIMESLMGKKDNVVDMKGQKIPPGSKIMGGEAVDDMPPPGSRGGSDDIAAPVQSSEESLKDMIEAENKKNIAAMKKRKMLAEAIDDASPGFADDIKYDAEIVAENLAERMGLVYDDLPTKQRLDLYDQAYTGLSKQRFKNKPKPDDDPEEKADGGRIGFVKGTGFRFLQKVFGKDKLEEMTTRDPEMYQGLLEVVDMYRKRDKEGLKMYLQKFLPQMDDEAIEDFIRGSDGTEGLIGELIRLGSGRDYAGKIEMLKRAENMRKLDDLEVTDKMIRKPNADGGIMRLGFKDGMNRRTFLKILGGAASIPIIGKIFKPFKIGKKVTQVPIIKTDNVPGKPEWFDQLVNKVIIEGDDVTKTFATGERQSIHQKRLDDGSVVRVTEDIDDGAVRVEYESETNVFGDTATMQYKKSLPDEGNPRPSAEFDVAESGPVGRVDGPDDFSLDVDEVGGSSISDLDSDVSILKEYATGQKPTMKELVQNIKRKDKAKRITEDPEAQNDAVIRRQGDYDPSYDDYASGGIAGMLGE